MRPPRAARRQSLPALGNSCLAATSRGTGAAIWEAERLERINLKDCRIDLAGPGGSAWPGMAGDPLTTGQIWMTVPQTGSRSGPSHGGRIGAGATAPAPPDLRTKQRHVAPCSSARAGRTRLPCTTKCRCARTSRRAGVSEGERRSGNRVLCAGRGQPRLPGATFGREARAASGLLQRPGRPSMTRSWMPFLHESELRAGVDFAKRQQG
jgi:hypothetical protein